MYPLISTCWVGRAYGTLKMQSLVFCVFLFYGKIKPGSASVKNQEQGKNAFVLRERETPVWQFFEEKEFPGRLSLAHLG